VTWTDRLLVALALAALALILWLYAAK